MVVFVLPHPVPWLLVLLINVQPLGGTIVGPLLHHPWCMAAIITWPGCTPVGLATVTLAKFPTACEEATKGIEQGEHCEKELAIGSTQLARKRRV